MENILEVVQTVIDLEQGPSRIQHSLFVGLRNGGPLLFQVWRSVKAIYEKVDDPI